MASLPCLEEDGTKTSPPNPSPWLRILNVDARNTHICASTWTFYWKRSVEHTLLSPVWMQHNRFPLNQDLRFCDGHFGREQLILSGKLKAAHYTNLKVWNPKRWTMSGGAVFSPCAISPSWLELHLGVGRFFQVFWFTSSLFYVFVFLLLKTISQKYHIRPHSSRALTLNQVWASV